MSYFLQCRQCNDHLYEKQLGLKVYAGHLVVQCPNCDYFNQVRILASGHVVRADSELGEGAMKKVFIVGEIFERRADGKATWDFCGVFEDEYSAVSACRRPNYFVGPAELNVLLPDEPVDWPGAYCPLLAFRMETG